MNKEPLILFRVILCMLFCVVSLSACQQGKFARQSPSISEGSSPEIYETSPTPEVNAVPTLAPMPSAPAKEPVLIIDPYGHSALITDVMFTSNGKRLISVADDKTIRVWDLETGKVLKTLRGQIGTGHEGRLYAGALSPDDQVLAVGGFLGSTDTVGREDLTLRKGQIRLFNMETGEQIGLLKGHTKAVMDLAFSHDGQWLISGSGDATVKIWNVGEIDTVQSEEQASRITPTITLKGHTKGVYGIALSPDGTRVVSASFDGTLRLWELPHDLKVSGNLTDLKFTEMKKHTAEVACVAYTPDGKYIISGGYDGRILLWENNGTFIREIDRISNHINTISCSADSKKCVATSGGKGGGQLIANVYSVPSGKKITTFKKHTNTIDASAFYGNDQIVTAGGNELDIYLWEAHSGSVSTHLSGQGKAVWAVAFGQGLEVAFGKRERFKSPLNRGPLEKTFNFSEMSISYNISDQDDFIRSRTTYQKKRLKAIDQYTLRIINGGTIKNDPASDGQLRAYTFTQNGNVTVASDHSLALYQNGGTLIRKFVGHSAGIWAVSVSRNGKLLASASYDQTIKLWNINTGELLASLFVASDNEWICWTPQGYYDASAGGEKYIGWHLNQGDDHSAKFYPVSVFRKQYHSPEMVKRTITLGSFELAFNQLKAENPSRAMLRGGPGRVPQFDWLSPRNVSTKQSENSIRIRVKIRSELEILTVRILVNGRTLASDQDVMTTRSSAYYKEIEHEIPLREETNEIWIFAANAETDTISDKRIVLYNSPDAVSWKPNLYMVSIGISEYSISQLHLNYADDDARAMSNFFRTQEGKMYEKVHLKELYDVEATQEKIVEALEWIEAQSKPLDVVIIFIAAHGYRSEKGKHYYILPTEGSPERMRTTGVSWGVLSEILGNLSSKVLLFLDTCHSGQMGQDLSIINNTEALRTLASEEYGVMILASSTGRETSQESAEWGHGAFTLALLEAMEQGKAYDANNDGLIDVRELDLYVANRVEALTQNQQHPTTQRPSTISRFFIAQVK